MGKTTRGTWVNAKLSPGLDGRHDCVALVLQGGGALGAYQAGAYQELAGTPHELDWIAGVSIGAINAALIAGNPPDRRIARLSEFWHLVSSGMVLPAAVMSASLWEKAASQLPHARSAFNQFSALWSAVLGIPGFFQPRVLPAWLRPDGTPEALGVYDTTPLRATLERLIDFDLINSRKLRLSVGAVNVRSGNSQYFDNFEGDVIGPEHIMASCALPPAFPPVTIAGEDYWDGGIVSNTPLQYLLDMRGKDSVLVFQIDLFSARGDRPVNLAGVQQRQKEILYSSRTRYNSNMAAEFINARKMVLDVLLKLPAKLRDDADVRRLCESLRAAPADIVHLIYRKAAYELESNDYEFSRESVLEHWQAGQCDLRDTLEHPDWLKSAGINAGVTQFDLIRHSRPVLAHS